MRPSKKQVGCCTLCGKEVFEVRERWPRDHPLAGEVRRIGSPLPSARRASLVLMSGVITYVTLCSSCPPTPERLPELWDICMDAQAQDIDNERRAVIGARPIADFLRETYISNTVKMVVDLPIAVLSIYPWEEDDEFAARTR